MSAYFFFNKLFGWSYNLDQVLELNTMYEYGQEKKAKVLFVLKFNGHLFYGHYYQSSPWLNEHEGASLSSSKERTKHSKINLGVRSQTVSPSSLLSSNIFIIISINSFSSLPPLSSFFQLLPCRDDDDCEKDGEASTKVFHQPSWDPQASEQVRHLDHHHDDH